MFTKSTPMYGRKPFRGRRYHSIYLRKGFRPYIGVLFVNIEELLFVVSQRFPFGKIFTSFWEMHFCAQRVRARKHDAYTQRIVAVPFPKLCDDPGKFPLINRVPRDRNRDRLPKIGSMRIHHTRFKSLSALGIDKSWCASA